jgi:two-component system, chemotaxis family, chemotaxis protein CheY
VKVLVVDDSRVMRQIVIRTLRQAGYGDWEVVEAEDGAAALAKARSCAPDLVLADWNMPKMTGIQLLGMLRSTGDSVPFAFVTSESAEDMHALARNAGALGVITKPFTAETFRDVLDVAVG